MKRVCNSNTWIIDGFDLVFQVVFVFAFLTIFFFAYVVKVEEGEFEDQMNFVVDEVLTEDIEKKLLAPTSKIPQAQVVATLSGIIDGVEYQAGQSTKSAVKSVIQSNNQVRANAFKTLGIVAGTLVLVSIVMLAIGYCLPVRHQTTEALWVVFWVAVTELTFLMVVAKNYKSADPNKVKRTLGAAIIKWIKNNKKIPNKNKAL